MEATAVKRESREWVTFENEGQKVFGMLHRPAALNPPIVIMMHGFASSKIGTNRSWVYLAQALAEAGIAALRFDFRGSGDSEGTLTEMSIKSLVSDGLKACEYVAREGFSEVALFGSSLGGAISVLTAAEHASIKSLALWAPVASGELWYRDFLTANPHLASVEPSQALASYQGVKLGEQFREEFRKMAAYKVIGALREVPLLHMHGDQDKTLSLAHQEAYEAARETAVAESAFVTCADTDHKLGVSATFPGILKTIVEWFEKTAWWKKHPLRWNA